MIAGIDGGGTGVEIGVVKIGREGVGEAGEEGIESIPNGVGLFLLLFDLGGGSGAFSFWIFLFVECTLLDLFTTTSGEASLVSSSNCSF